MVQLIRLDVYVEIGENEVRKSKLNARASMMRNDIKEFMEYMLESEDE